MITNRVWFTFNST